MNFVDDEVIMKYFAYTDDNFRKMLKHGFFPTAFLQKYIKYD